MLFISYLFYKTLNFEIDFLLRSTGDKSFCPKFFTLITAPLCFSTVLDIPATTKWYIILVAVISGIILIIVFCSIILLYRRRFVLNNKNKQNEQLQSPGIESTDVNNGAYEEVKLSDISKRNDNEALTDRDDLNYQKLDVSKMDREENYQSLMDMPYVNIKDKTYQD